MSIEARAPRNNPNDTFSGTGTSWRREVHGHARTGHFVGPGPTSSSPIAPHPRPYPPSSWARPVPGPAARPEVAPATVIGLILAGVAVITGWIPVVSFVMFVLALGGLVLGVIGLARSAPGARRWAAGAVAVGTVAVLVTLTASAIGAQLLIHRAEARALGAPTPAATAPSTPEASSHSARDADPAIPELDPRNDDTTGVTRSGPGPESIYLKVLANAGVRVTEPRAAIRVGHGVCSLTYRGASQPDVIAKVQAATGLPRLQAASVAGAAKGSFCPGRR
jgi:hypothetical protein